MRLKLMAAAAILAASLALPAFAGDLTPKAAGEILCAQSALSKNLDIRIARPFNLIGPGQDARFAISSFASQVATLERAGGGAIRVGNLDVTRDFVDVRDAVTALLAILCNGGRGQTYIICSEREVSISDMLRRLVSRARVPLEVVVDPQKVRPAEQRRVCGSVDKLHGDTGWKPSFDVERTLDAVLDYWRAVSVAPTD